MPPSVLQGINHISSYWGERRKALDAAANPAADAVVRVPGAVPALALRLIAVPELEFQISGFDPTVSWEDAEATLRRFVHERVRRCS
jgi:hypothetical protein